MTSEEISQIVDSAFDSAFSNWSKSIEKELYPDAFADKHSWIRVKNSFSLNNAAIKEAVKQSLTKALFSD